MAQTIVVINSLNLQSFRKRARLFLADAKLEVQEKIGDINCKMVGSSLQRSERNSVTVNSYKSGLFSIETQNFLYNHPHFDQRYFSLQNKSNFMKIGLWDCLGNAYVTKVMKTSFRIQFWKVV